MNVKIKILPNSTNNIPKVDEPQFLPTARLLPFHDNCRSFLACLKLKFSKTRLIWILNCTFFTRPKALFPAHARSLTPAFFQASDDFEVLHSLLKRRDLPTRHAQTTTQINNRKTYFAADEGLYHRHHKKQEDVMVWKDPTVLDLGYEGVSVKCEML